MILYNYKILGNVGFPNTIQYKYYSILYVYRVTQKGWDFRDDCAEFIWSISLYLCFFAAVNLFLFLQNHYKGHIITIIRTEDFIYPWNRHTCKVFQVVFIILSFVGNIFPKPVLVIPVYYNSPLLSRVLIVLQEYFSLYFVILRYIQFIPLGGAKRN